MLGLGRMPRDMAGTGRYPPVPKFPPFAFYSCVRLGDPEQLAKVMREDPYFWTQDNGAGAPVHFATTYKQLDMLHHLLNNGAEVNQRDNRGMTPLHRAAYLAHYEGYLEIYEYLLSRGADPTVLTEDYDPYLNPGRKKPIDVSVDKPEVRAKIAELEKRYARTGKAKIPHEDIGDWWALYDYGLEAIKKWDVNYKPPYPEVQKRAKDDADYKKMKAERKARRALLESGAVQEAKPVPKTPVAFLFPGQGSQKVGMGSECMDLPKVQEMFATAEKILGYDLKDICLNGPKEKLDQTEFAQPALFVCGLAAVEKLRKEDPGAVAKASCTAGLSLGEYTALVFSGVMSFEDALKVVKVRGESMAAAAKAGDPHGMLSIVGLADADVEEVCAKARDAVPGSVCQMANYLFPKGRVVSGTITALDEAQKIATAKGALKAQRVAVSGAFHTPLMSSASEALEKVLGEVTINEPQIPVFSNVTATQFPDAASIRPLLKRQLCEPVRWEDTLRTLIGAGKNSMYELGPNKQIRSMVKRVDGDVWKAFTNVEP